MGHLVFLCCASWFVPFAHATSCFFVMTLRAIDTTVTQARAALHHSNHRQNFGIYVRLASIMGFTWVLGFLAPFISQLWYPFVLFNCSQGVYIALAFALNKRARNLYRKYIGSHKVATLPKHCARVTPTQATRSDDENDDTKL